MNKTKGSTARADPLVLFGVTGDLAYKMIFPVLYAMAKRCALKVAVIGWAMGHRLTVDLAEQALTIALANRNPQAGPLHHSERGSQGGFKWSLQHLDEGGCDEHSKAPFGSVWAAALAVTRSTVGGRTR
jgi:hypothetical protein